LNPIEKAWSKLKQMLRQAKARTAEATRSGHRDGHPGDFTSQRSGLVPALFSWYMAE
jgi:transposase